MKIEKNIWFNIVIETKREIKVLKMALDKLASDPDTILDIKDTANQMIYDINSAEKQNA